MVERVERAMRVAEKLDADVVDNCFEKRSCEESVLWVMD